MERSELLARLGFAPPEACRVRVIIDTDAKNEGDDDFAILHHLLTPQFDVRGICATHFEVKTTQRGLPPHSMERSYQEVCRLLNAAHIDDVPVLHGCTAPLASPEDAPDCEAVEFLIQEALRDDPAPLYIAAQGAMTNIAAALNRAPEIASRMTVLWNGGGPYPAGRPEFNVQQDPIACRVLLDSAVTVWQIPQDVYARFEVSLSELALRVRPCGEVGAYLFRQLMDEYPSEYDPRFPLRTGGNWTLGDNTTAAVLLENGFRGHWTLRPAPVLLDSAVTVWQIPQDVYARFEVSLSELALRVRPCGEVGAYLFRQLMDEYPSEYDPRFPLRTGGNWTLGDNTTAAVLLENGFRGHWTLRPAPVLLPSLTYAEASDRKTIRVYHDLDVRFALEDFYSKLALCYPR